MGTHLTQHQQRPAVFGTLQLAEKLGKSKSFVFHLVKTGQLTPQNIGGGVFVFFGDDVQQYLNKQKSQA